MKPIYCLIIFGLAVSLACSTSTIATRTSEPTQILPTEQATIKESPITNINPSTNTSNTAQTVEIPPASTVEVETSTATETPSATSTPWTYKDLQEGESPSCHEQNEFEWIYAHFSSTATCYVRVDGPEWARRLAIYEDSGNTYILQHTFDLPYGWQPTEGGGWEVLQSSGYQISLVTRNDHTYMQVVTVNDGEYVLMQDAQVNLDNIATFPDSWSK